jgi:micrococcal nuclease
MSTTPDPLSFSKSYPFQSEDIRERRICPGCEAPYYGTAGTQLCRVCATPELWADLPTLERPHVPTPYAFPADVHKVVDGDTLDLTIEQGLYSQQKRRVRIRGVNAPEMKGATMEAAREAKEFLADLIGPAEAGKPYPRIVVRTYKPDKWGRVVVDAWTAAGEHVGIELIRNKHAVPFVPS